MKISIIRKLILLLFVSIPLSLASHSVGSEETLLDLIDSLESDSKKKFNSKSIDELYIESVFEKVNATYAKLITKSDVANIQGNIRIKFSLNQKGELVSVEFINTNTKKEYKNGIRTLLESSSPFNEFPDEIKETTDIIELIYTLQFLNRIEFNKAMYGINP